MVWFGELEAHLCSARSNHLSLFQSLQGSGLGSTLLGHSLRLGHGLFICHCSLLRRSLLLSHSLHLSCSLLLGNSLLGHRLPSREKYDAFAKLSDLFGRELEKGCSCTSVGKPPFAEINFVIDSPSDYCDVCGTAYQVSRGIVDW